MILSFFCTRTMGLAQGLWDGWTMLPFCISLNCMAISCWTAKGTRRGGCLLGTLSPVLISSSTRLVCHHSPSRLKTSWYSSESDHSMSFSNTYIDMSSNSRLSCSLNRFFLCLVEVTTLTSVWKWFGWQKTSSGFQVGGSMYGQIHYVFQSS